MTGYNLHGKRQGLWLSFHPNGMLSDSTVYDNGNQIGTSLSWYATVEIYDHGKLQDKQYFDETRTALVDTTNKDRGAVFKGGSKDWLKYLENHLTFPAYCKE
jgi:hypothetical protein